MYFSWPISETAVFYLLRERRQDRQQAIILACEELVAMGKLKRGSRDYSENIITRAVGVSEDVDTDLFALKLKSGDQILMCSDGFKQHGG